MNPFLRRPLLAVVLLAGLLCHCAAPEKTGAVGEPKTALEQVARAYAIDIVFQAPAFPVPIDDGNIEGSAADARHLAAYVPLFVREFSLYPPELVARTKLKRVVLCENLAFSGQRRNAVPDFDHDTLYLEVARGAKDPSYLRKVIHHDFYHIMDLRDDGELYRDDVWAALNPAGFQYGSGGHNAQNNKNSAVLTDAIPGFVDYYATTGVEEDKAEVYANLVVNAAWMRGRAAKDPVVAAKALRMRKLMADFCPQMDAGFWNASGNLVRAPI